MTAAEFLTGPFRIALAIILGALLVAWCISAVQSHRARRRSAWNRRFADARFTPRQDVVREAYRAYEAPTYLRTRAEEERLMPRPSAPGSTIPSILRPQAGDL